MNFPPANSQSELVAEGQVLEARQVEAVVYAVLHEFHQVKVRDSDGHFYAITRMTTGIDLRSLREGQCVRCTVTLKLPRVLCAEAVA